MGRRVRKRVETYNGSSWPETSDELFVYDGWNVVLVLNGSNETVRKFTWGLDLSGTLHGAGGIGGLLAVDETQGTYQGTYWYFYDGNGNVGQLVKTIKDGQGNITGVESTLAARYEYDPYGNPIPIPQPPGPGPYADLNPFRFSTKWFDDETGLYYYGYRYYSPRLGRWISRDPIEEGDALNLYSFVDNHPAGRIDLLGLWGRDVHEAKTTDWAAATGMAQWAAERVGYACNGVDPPTWQWPLKTTEATLEWHFDIPVTRPNVWGYADSRYVHSTDEAYLAFVKCRDATSDDDVVAALDHLGQALHPLEDWVAHGVWDPTYHWYNATNWRAHPAGTDDFGKDDSRTSDGRLHDDLTSAKKQSQYLVAGSKRAELTRAMADKALLNFKKNVKRLINQRCWCKLYVWK